MKNNYSKLKWTVLLRTFLVSVLVVAVGYGILTFLVDIFWQDASANFIVSLLSHFGISSWRAEEWYNRIFVNHKLTLAAIGFSVVFFVLFSYEIGKMTKYLNDISDAMDKILDDSDEPIVLAPVLEPLAEKLGTLKTKLTCRKQQAAESEQRRNELVVCLAHDLRTPLTSVTAYLTMLDEHPDMPKEERIKYTHITLEKAIRLEELMNEFFEITRFNQQDLTLEKQEIHLSMLLEQLADESYGLLNEKNMTCAVDVEEGLVMQGDPDKLARVFDNLLRNAAAYGYEGTQILIQARGGAGRITIVFTNEGAQIPQKKLEMIFEKFYRIDDARSSQTGGAGLGLAIAKQIVELHGGTISAASDSRSTRFIVSIPSHTETMRSDQNVRRLQRKPAKGKPDGK